MSKTGIIIAVGAFVAALLLLPSMSRAANIYMITDWLIPEFEGFVAHPYWDVSRWSWGFGTPAPGQSGTITRQQATEEMRLRVQQDYNYLRPLITRDLNANQWAALLSFSYNLGSGGADNLVANINAGNDAALETQWKKYIYAGGVVNQTLIDRRNREWEVWTS